LVGLSEDCKSVDGSVGESLMDQSVSHLVGPSEGWSVG